MVDTELSKSASSMNSSKKRQVNFFHPSLLESDPEAWEAKYQQYRQDAVTRGNETATQLSDLPAFPEGYFVQEYGF